jgi:Asp-tRNA(Asn)/Glu-tRNA(Gln) amidotransferase A subunit family amidase
VLAGLSLLLLPVLLSLLLLRRHPAKADAPCVAALKELGAVLLGKGSMVELGIFAHGQNPHSGAILNPHHPSRTAGGSSSGAAAAVAVGLCPIAIGTDGGGSIRIPASYCGVTGLKPTAGRLADDHGKCQQLVCRTYFPTLSQCALLSRVHFTPSHGVLACHDCPASRKGL